MSLFKPEEIFELSYRCELLRREAELIREQRAIGEAIGEARGEVIGEARGEVIGEARGEAIGEAREKLKTFRQLLAKFDKATIIDVMGLSEEEFYQMKEA